MGSPILNRPIFELTRIRLDGHDFADQAVLLNRNSTGLSPCSPSLMRACTMVRIVTRMNAHDG